MKLYTSDGCAYDGMSEETIVRLRSELGRATTFITQTEYDVLIASFQKDF